MTNGAQATRRIALGQDNLVTLTLGNPAFCQAAQNVLFDVASSFITPTPDHKRAYQLVLQRLNGGTGEQLLVVGHTDDTGQSGTNDLLSERRASGALAVLSGNVAQWEANFIAERGTRTPSPWGDATFQLMLTEVGVTPSPAVIRQHLELSPTGQARRATLFTQYFNRLLGSPTTPPTVRSLTPPVLGCGERHALASGDHGPSRRAEFFFFRSGGVPTISCDAYPSWRNPCAPIPLPPPAVVNAFFVSGTGDDGRGTGSQSNPWRTIRHSLQQVAALRQAGQHATLHVLAGTYFENITLSSETTLEGAVVPLPEIRGIDDAPVILVSGARNSNIRNMRVTQGRRSGIRIEQSTTIGVNGCVITDNFAPRGGGVSLSAANSITIEDNTIERNRAGTIATAITAVDIDAAITSQEIELFDIQVGDGHGGGVYLENSQAIFIRNNRIRENQAILFGGGIGVDNRPGFNGPVEIADNEITCNQCSHSDLGPLAAPGISCSTGDMNDPIVERFTEETLSAVARRAAILLHGVGIEGGMGGGIALRHVSPQTQLLRNRIGAESRPNRARRGGGVECFTGAYPVLRENSIEFNLSADDGGGIAIDQFDPFLPRTQPTFLSFRRGAIVLRQTIELINNRIRFNRCISDGGGIYATGNPRLTISGNNTVIEGNRAGENGGGIRVSYAARLTVTDARIIDNQANAIGAERDGGGGIAARNAEVRLQGCELSGNIANNFAGGAIFCTAGFEGGFNAGGFVGNQFGQFDQIMRDDYGFGLRSYHFIDCRGSNNQATGASGAGGFMYCVRVEGDLAIEIFIQGARTAIGANTSTFERNGSREKRGNVVLELSGRQRSGQPEDRVFISGDVPSVAAGGIIASAPAPDNHPVVVIRGPGLPTDRPTTFPFVFGAAPVIADVQPRFGPIAGGTVLMITGQHFLIGATITFNGTPATVLSVTDTLISATTPPGALGTVDVVVQNPDGQRDQVNGGFEYVLPPQIFDVQPRDGLNIGGTALTITGTNFLTGVLVLVGGRLASDVILVSPTEITATTPPAPGTVGPVDVTVRNADSQSQTVRGGFTYRVSSPRISNVQPRSGSRTAATGVTVSGTDFLAGAQLFIGGQLAGNITVISSTQIDAVAPAQPAVSGLVDVEVRNPDTSSDIVRGGFEYTSP